MALHYNLVGRDPAEDFAACSAATRFGDGNDLLLKVFGAERMERREGWVSRTYRQRTERPAYAFTVRKRAGEPVRLGDGAVLGRGRSGAASKPPGAGPAASQNRRKEIQPKK